MTAYKIDKARIKAQAEGRWLEIFRALEPRLNQACDNVGKHVPCPIGTGTQDGFRLDADANQTGIGYHNQYEKHGFGDGIALLCYFTGWSFYECLKNIGAYLNNSDFKPEYKPSATRTSESKPRNSEGAKRALDAILARATQSANDETRAYLVSRGLSPDFEYVSVLHHKGVAIRCNGKIVHKGASWLTVPAIVGRLSSSKGWLGASIVRVKDGRKASDYMTSQARLLGYEPQAPIPSRQFIKSAESLSGGAIRFGKAGKVLYVGEGLETMLAVSQALNTNSVAAACTKALLSLVEIPAHVETLVVCADKDRNDDGYRAALALAEREHVERDVKIILPPSDIPDDAKGVDWLDDIAHLRSALQIAGV